MELEKYIDELKAAAIEARKFASVNAANFTVGAALLTKSGKIYTGCNINTSTLLFNVCAEQTAIVKAISEGEKEFVAIAVCGEEAEKEYDRLLPCGTCRQLLAECNPNMKVIEFNKTQTVIHTVKDLIPHSFDI
ncbi:MAG: cytidine deaminase [Clostridia bacterium]|nr:cytidine deaminase [Clostridia bacterium]